MAQYFYDNQTRRWISQFMRIFSNWSVTFGNDPQGNPILHSVPVNYGDMSRQVGAIINNNSPSTLPAVPFISIYISGYEYDQKRMQDPTFQDNLVVRQRAINPVTGQYETTQGQAFTVKRIMPVPYNLKFSVDIWTSNYQQKLELFEQLSVLFNPSLELQSNQNMVDWTSLSVVYQDGITWTNRTIPIGTDNPIDIMTWKFYTPIWLSSPIKVEKLGIIQKIIASVFQGSALEDTQNQDLLLGQRQKITPYGYKVLLVGNTLQLLPSNETEITPNNDIQSVASVLVSGYDPTSNFVFYTEDPCLNIEVGQWIQFDGISDYPTVTSIASSPNGQTAITVSTQQNFASIIGMEVDFLIKLNPATNLFWQAYLNVYGTVRPGVSMIILENPNLPTDIVGTIDFNPTDDRLLIYTINPATLPKNTLQPVISVIDPTQKYPNTLSNMSGTLPIAAAGQRYLIVNPIGTEDTASLQFINGAVVPTGSTTFYILQSFDVPESDYIGATISATDPTTGSIIFQYGTKITAISTDIHGNMFITVDTPSVNPVPATFNMTTQSISLNIKIQTGVQETNAAWGGLVANANDIIEYGNIAISTTANQTFSGQSAIVVASVTGVQVGYTMLLGTTVLGTIGEILGTTVILTTPLTTGILNNSVVTFTSVGWYIATDSTTNANIDFVTNMTTDIQYRWADGQWSKSYEGWYDQGDYSIVI